MHKFNGQIYLLTSLINKDKLYQFNIILLIYGEKRRLVTLFMYYRLYKLFSFLIEAYLIKK